MKTTKIKLLSLLLLISINTLIAQINSDQILGKWASEDGDLTVLIYKENGKYAGKIIDAKDKKQIGKLIIWGLIFDKDESEWSQGEVKKPDMPHSAKCYVRIKDSKVVVTGYHGIKLFSSSETFLRKQ